MLLSCRGKRHLMHDALTKAGVKHTWSEDPGYGHDYQIWRQVPLPADAADLPRLISRHGFNCGPRRAIAFRHDAFSAQDHFECHRARKIGKRRQTEANRGEDWKSPNRCGCER